MKTKSEIRHGNEIGTAACACYLNEAIYHDCYKSNANGNKKF